MAGYGVRCASARTILLEENVAAFDKFAGGVDGFLQVAAGIIAQIEYDGSRAQLFSLDKVGFELVGDARIEAQNLDMRDMRLGNVVHNYAGYFKFSAGDDDGD